jgi:uncharacterized protein (DUF1697 family)
VAWVVFLRGANVGGGNVFRPSAVAKELPELGLVSLGAAGTFVARTGRSAAAVRKAIGAKLPFYPPMMVIPGAQVVGLLRRDPVGASNLAPGVRKFVSVAGAPLSGSVALPLAVPDATSWGVRILAIDGPFALGVCRRFGTRMFYPNDAVERAFSTMTTTRWWETLVGAGRVLGADAPGAP